MAKAIPVPRMSAMDRQWQAESDLRTLKQAQEIQASRARRSAAASEAKKQMSALQKIGGKPAPKKKG